MSQSKSQPPETPRPPAAGFKAGLFVGLSVTAGLILIAAIVVAYIFLVHIPNKPENVYRRGMGSIGAGIQYLITPDFLNEIASTSFSGEMTVVNYTEKDFINPNFRLRFDGQYDTANALLNAAAELNYETSVFGEPDNFMGSVDMNAIFVNATDDEAPKLYFRFNDLDLPWEYREELDASLESLLGGTLEDLLGGWLLLDFQTLIDAGLITDDDLSEIDLEQEISQEESQEVVLLLTENLSEYVFTSETEKMVFSTLR